jgi:ElaB/YqjD/DUF883 family membrane-anchored ribosome-binding protein
MDPQPDVIRQQIDQTRSSLTEKLETLEAEVKGTVESAKDAVEETLSTARETVQETITSVRETVETATETVKRTFDIPYQVDRHPWAMLGLSAVTGVVAGALLGSHLGNGRRVARRMAEASAGPEERAGVNPSEVRFRVAPDRSSGPGFMDKLSDRFGDEFEKVKDLAIATLVGVAADVAKKAIPALGAAVEDMMLRAASEAGAPPRQYGEEHWEGTAAPGYQPPPRY